MNSGELECWGKRAWTCYSRPLPVLSPGRCIELMALYRWTHDWCDSKCEVSLGGLSKLISNNLTLRNKPCIGMFSYARIHQMFYEGMIKYPAVMVRLFPQISRSTLKIISLIYKMKTCEHGICRLIQPCLFGVCAKEAIFPPQVYLENVKRWLDLEGPYQHNIFFLRVLATVARVQSECTLDLHEVLSISLRISFSSLWYVSCMYISRFTAGIWWRLMAQSTTLWHCMIETHYKGALVCEVCATKTHLLRSLSLSHFWYDTDFIYNLWQLPIQTPTPFTYPLWGLQNLKLKDGQPTRWHSFMPPKYL